MNINEQIVYAKTRLAGAIYFEKNLIEAEKWRKALLELSVQKDLSAIAQEFKRNSGKDEIKSQDSAKIF